MRLLYWSMVSRITTVLLQIIRPTEAAWTISTGIRLIAVIISSRSTSHTHTHGELVLSLRVSNSRSFALGPVTLLKQAIGQHLA